MIKFIKFVVRTGVVILLVIALITLVSLEKNTDICETMTRTFSRFNVKVASWISSWVPFSLTELTFAILGITVLFLLIVAIVLLVKKKIFGSLYRIVEIAGIVLFTINIYHLSCEFAYNRKELPLPFYESQIARDEHVNIYNYFADDLNYCISQLEFEESGEVKTSMSLNDIAKEVKKAYKIIEGNDYYASHFGSVKPMLSSFLYTEFQITGVTYSPLGEANINTHNTKTNIPLTVAHELAHTKGVMREDDANQLAFYVCLNSDNPYLRYAVYVDYYDQLEAIVTPYYLTEEERDNLHKDGIPTLNKSRTYEYQFWKKHNLLKNIGEFFNDLYIKSSGVKEGTSSYSGGSEYVHDPLTSELKQASLYQKLFFEKYYRS